MLPGIAPIVAVGDLVVDHLLWVNRSSGVEYHGAAGGGSAHNIAANAARAGAKCIAVGASGDDWRSDLACTQLLGLGIEPLISRVRGKITRSYWQIPDGLPSELSLSTQRYRTTGTCAVCRRSPPANAIARLDEATWFDLRTGSAFAAIVTDRLAPEYLQVVRKLRSRKTITVLDFGKLGFLRSHSAAEILSSFAVFDLVVTQNSLAQSLLRRLGMNSISELAEYGPRKALIVSAGPKGLSLHLAGPLKSSHSFPAPVVDYVVDDVGAGDAFLGQLLARLIRAGGDESREIDWSNFPRLVEGTVGANVAVLRHFGARGHLDVGTEAKYPTIQFIGQDLESLRKHMADSEVCLLCGLEV